jgi:hypothetical protein
MSPSRSDVALQACRDVAAGVNHPQYVDRVALREVEDQIQVALDEPVAQSGYVELLGIARRSARRIVADLSERMLEGLNEPKGHRRATLLAIVVNGRLDVLIRAGADDEAPGGHRRGVRRRARRRRLSK